MSAASQEGPSVVLDAEFSARARRLFNLQPRCEVVSLTEGILVREAKGVFRSTTEVIFKTANARVFAYRYPGDLTSLVQALAETAPSAAEPRT